MCGSLSTGPLNERMPAPNSRISNPRENRGQKSTLVAERHNFVKSCRIRHKSNMTSRGADIARQHTAQSHFVTPPGI